MSRAITIVLLVVSTAAPALAGASKDFTHAWSRRFGGEQIELLRDVCVDGAGNVIVCGHHAGDIDFGGGTLSCAGGDDAFLAKFDVDGNHIWSRSFGDSSDQQGIAVGVDAAGNIYLTGWFRSIVDFGGGPLTGPGNEDTFLAKFDGLGNHLWSIARGGTGSDRPNDLVVDSWGNVVITGWFYGPVADFCGGLGCAGGQDIYLVKYNPYGTCLYAFSWGDASNQQGLAVAVDMNDDILLAGEFYGTVDFGSGPLTSAGQADVFLAKFYGDTGQIYFAYSYGDADHDAVAAVAADLDYIYLGGSTVASIDFGGGALDGGAGWDVYVACLDAYGAHYWSRIFPDADGSFMMDLILTDTHCPAITGYYGDRIDFGGGELVSAGQEDIFVAVLDPGDGGHVESASFGGTGLDYGDALASAPGDYLVLGGYTDGTIDLGGGPLANAGYYDVLLARYLLGPPGFPPEVVVSIPDLLVQETAPPVDNHVCLTDVFWDPEEGSALAYEVVGWTNLDLLTATVDADSCLDISFNELMDGAAVVTVRATDSVGRSIEDAFEVTVEPLPDAPLIQGIADVPNDQGRTVRITLRRSGQDDLGATTPILQYEAWRRLDPLPPAAAGRPVPPVRGAPVSASDKSFEDWEFAGAVPAHGHTTYSLIVPTLADSTISDGLHMSVFFVRAATAAPLTYYDSAPDSGYSVDNLAPNAPEGFAAAYGAGVALSWEPSADADFRYFKIYRGDAPGFAIDPGNPLQTTVDSAWLDGGGGFDSFYRISAIDFAGNESPAVAPTTTTGASDAPSAFKLHGAHPNPFNPRTTIAFELPAAAHVDFRIHDVSGRVVRTLASGVPYAAGRHELVWDGVDDAGRAVASGVYVGRASARGAVCRVRLMLVR